MVRIAGKKSLKRGAATTRSTCLNVCNVLNQVWSSRGPLWLIYCGGFLLRDAMLVADVLYSFTRSDERAALFGSARTIIIKQWQRAFVRESTSRMIIDEMGGRGWQR